MKIEKNKVVTFHYRLTDGHGETLEDTWEEKMAALYLHGTETLLPAIEEKLEGCETGTKINVTLPPEQAFGEVDDELLMEIPLEDFQGQQVEPGMVFEAPIDSEEDIRMITVLELKDQGVMVDANHPYAGETLTFDIEILAVRDATAEEIEHGHVHEPGASCEHDHEE